MINDELSKQPDQILRKFDLNLLLVFEALITECHVTRAAKKLYLSQPAVSHALNRMRNELDDSLLIKTEKGMRPTPRALKMLPQVQQILKLIENTLAPPVRFDPEVSERKFVIATTDYFELMLYPLLLAEVRKLAPAIRFEIELITDEVLHSGLDTRQVDLVVGLEATHEIPKGLVKKTLFKENLVCLASRNNRNIGDSLTLASFTEQPHVAFIDLAGYRPNVVDLWLEQRQLSRRTVSRNLSYTAAARIVALSDAIITLPCRMAELFSEIFPLRIVTPPKGLAEVEITMIHHPLYARDPAIAWLMEQIEKTIR
ncbi:MAG: LysR family transcriptional regulator [Amphritea sp.]